MSVTYDQHLYAIMWPNYGLVASNLGPEEFGRHYTIGSSRFFKGSVLFAKVDQSFRHPFFPIDRVLEEVVPNADGEPKRTKFISTYRVLEHIDLKALGSLYVTSVEGTVLELKPASYQKKHQPGFIRAFQEICPMRSIALTFMTPQEFGRYITEPGQTKGAPAVMFTQIDFRIDHFLEMIEQNPYHNSPIPNIHPQKLREQILEFRSTPNKRVKGISLDSALDKISFLKLRTGFWFAREDELIFYPIPSLSTLEQDHFDWLRSLGV